MARDREETLEVRRCRRRIALNRSIEALRTKLDFYLWQTEVLEKRLLDLLKFKASFEKKDLKNNKKIIKDTTYTILPKDQYQEAPNMSTRFISKRQNKDPRAK